MNIKEELAAELKDAMKSQDSARRDVIRQVRSAPGFSGDVDDAFYQKVIASYVKKMDKTRAEYEGYGDRGADMASKLAYEVEYLSQWLPQKLDEAGTRDLVKEAIGELGVTGDEKAAGRVTGYLMKQRGSDLDGGLVNRIVREELGSG